MSDNSNQKSLYHIAKETATKSFVDKLIFGLISTLIIFSFQQAYQTNLRANLETEALLKMESQFITEGVITLKNHISGYVQAVSKPILLGVAPTDEESSGFFANQISIESEIEMLSAYSPLLKPGGEALVSSVKELNSQLSSFQTAKLENYRDGLDTVKDEYREFLSKLTETAIESLPNT